MSEQLVADRVPGKTIEPADDGATDGAERPADEQASVGEQSLPLDVIFSLLSAKRRREVLTYMAENGPETTLGDLADHIAAKENDTEIRLLSSQQRKRVYVALYQCHLPKMDDVDIIDFNQPRGTVARRPNASSLYRYMEVDLTESDGSAEPIADRIRSVRSKLGGWLQNWKAPVSAVPNLLN